MASPSGAGLLAEAERVLKNTHIPNPRQPASNSVYTWPMRTLTLNSSPSGRPLGKDRVHLSVMVSGYIFPGLDDAPLRRDWLPD